MYSKERLARDHPENEYPRRCRPTSASWESGLHIQTAHLCVPGTVDGNTSLVDVMDTTSCMHSHQSSAEIRFSELDHEKAEESDTSAEESYL